MLLYAVQAICVCMKVTKLTESDSDTLFWRPNGSMVAHSMVHARLFERCNFNIRLR